MSEEALVAYDYLVKHGDSPLIDEACHGKFSIEATSEAMSFRFFELDHPFISWVLFKLGRRPRWTAPW